MSQSHHGNYPHTANINSADLVADLEHDEEGHYPSGAEPGGMRDATLVVLDTNSSMFIPLPSDHSDSDDDDDKPSRRIPFFMATLAIYEILQERAVSNPRDFLGLLLFNTNQSNLINAPGMFLYLPLDQPDPNAILSILELSHGNPCTDGTISSLSTTINPVTVLSEALRQFREIKNKVGGKRLIWITNQDAPYMDQQPATNHDQYKHALKTRVQDLRHSGIQFSPYFVPPPTGQPFRLDRLWSGLLDDSAFSVSSDKDRLYGDSPFVCTTANLITVAPSYEVLLEAIKRREAKQRSIFRVPFYITDELVIGVRGLLQYRNAHRPAAVPLLAATHEPLVRINQTICPSTTEILDKDRIVSMYELGHTPVPIHPKRMATLHEWGQPSIKLLGFKCRSKLRRSHNLTHSTLIIPDEAQYSGSITTFVSLLEQLHVQNKFAVVQWYPRRGSTPRLAALLPQWEKYDDIGMVQPSALVAIPLPYQDELRQVKWPKNPVLEEAEQQYDQDPSPANEARVDQCMQNIQAQAEWLANELLYPVIRKWKWTGFDPMDRSNPSISKFRTLLQSHALDKPMPLPSELECGMAVDPELWLASAAREHALIFNEKMGPPVMATSTAPRSTAQVANDTKLRFNDQDVADPAQRLAVMRQTWESGRLHNCLVKDLKSFCSSVKLPVSGTKNQLVERIAHFFESPQDK